MATVGDRKLPAAWGWARTRRLNLGLLLLLVLAVVATVLVITHPGGREPVTRTATVTRGDVTALVTGSGNAESSLRTPVSFEGSGTVTSVTVQPGDTVTLGQTLATIDAAAAQAELRTAEAQLAGAQAALDQARAGPTDVQSQQDQLTITQAEQALDNARTAVTAAEKQLELDRTATQSAIDSAKTELANDDKATSTAIENAEDKLDADEKTQKTLVAQAEAEEKSACGSTSSLTEDDEESGSTSGSCSSAKLATRNAENTRNSVLLAGKQAVTTAKQTRESTLDQREQAVTDAEHTRSDTLLKGQTTIETDKQAVTKAEGDVTAARLTAEGNAHPQTPEEIAQAQATVDSAQVDVDTARRGVDETALKAPQAGVVLAVNGEVGGSAGGQGSDDDSGSSGDGGGSDSGDSAASDAAGSAGDGFAVIANPSELAVTAEVPEADAAKLELGQQATVSFPATGTTATGTVTRKDPQSTVSNDVVLYPVTISLETAPAGVGVGATANLSVTTGSATGVLKAPTQAVTTTGNRSTVTVRRDGTDTVVPVRIGVSGPADTEILSGVDEGDVLVLPSPNVATAGSGAGFPRTGGR
ncbi:HlyD family efflux transporter periplasmic adaptor subunit [Pseudonocardia sp. DLS-67]